MRNGDQQEAKNDHDKIFLGEVVGAAIAGIGADRLPVRGEQDRQERHDRRHYPAGIGTAGGAERDQDGERSLRPISRRAKPVELRPVGGGQLRRLGHVRPAARRLDEYVHSSLVRADLLLAELPVRKPAPEHELADVTCIILSGFRCSGESSGDGANVPG